jgi:Uncharacterized protein conserved in bacteria (DUF2076)
LVEELFDRLAKLENSPRDPAAERVIADGLRRAPQATYAGADSPRPGRGAQARERAYRRIAGGSAQIANLKLTLDVAVTAAMDAQVAIADIVLALLTKADALCEIAEATGADLTSIARAMGNYITSTEGVTQ